MVVPPLGRPREVADDGHGKNDASGPEDKSGPSITNTAAFRILEQLSESGDISKSAIEVYKSKFSQLYNSLQQAATREKALARNAKQLNNELLAVKITSEKESIARSERAAQTSALEQQRNLGLRNLRESDERDSTLAVELIELEKAKQDYERQHQELLKENESIVGPEFQRVQAAIKAQEEEDQRIDLSLKEETKRREDLLARQLGILSKTAELEKLLEEKKLHLNKNQVKGDPERLRKQADVVQKAVDSSKNDLRRLLERTAEIDLDLTSSLQKAQAAEEAAKELNYRVTTNAETIDQKEAEHEELAKALELEKMEHHQLITRRVELELHQDAARDQFKFENERLLNATKEFDRLKKAYKRKQIMVDQAKMVLPNLKAQVTDTKKQLELLQRDNALSKVKLEEIKQQIALFLAKFLKQENLEEAQKERLERLTKDVRTLEEELALWIAEELKQRKLIATLSAQREIKARECSKAQLNGQETREQVKIKELEVIDLTKRCNDANNRLKEYSALYDVVKSERNKYVNLIQISTQVLAEMKEKIQILMNEVEILRNESQSKVRLITKEQLAHQLSVNKRDYLRTEMNRFQDSYRQKQELVEQQIMEIDKHNSIINNLEKDMMKLKKEFEMAVDARNQIGIQLIARNDELCILYEKSNLYEIRLKEGELLLKEREADIRRLHTELMELKRRLEVLRKKIPRAPQYVEQILKLTKELEEEQKTSESLCSLIENPSLSDRWKTLEGQDPDSLQLSSKLQVLEERLTYRKDHLIAKELILEEVTAQIEELKAQAKSSRDANLEAARKVNDLQARIKEINRKTMAHVSELSMFQAIVVKLEKQCHRVRDEHQQAKDKLAQGEVPTAEAEQEWHRLQREKHRGQGTNISSENSHRYVGKYNVKTTAEARPSAYVSDELGIPKPYGAQAPFRPQEAGSTMRHMRKPVQKDIEI